MKKALKILKALADPTRLRIVAILLRSEVCVCELVSILKMEQSRISHQLRILRDADIVEDRRDGKWIVYAIPVRSRPVLKLLLGTFLKESSAESEEIRNDLEKIQTCLRQSPRKGLRLRSLSLRRTP
jgi:ArsR family transcriptional regulator